MVGAGLGHERVCHGAGRLRRATLPFSPLGVAALRAAREQAHASGEATVRAAHLLWAAIRALPTDLLELVVEAGFDDAGMAHVPHVITAGEPVPHEGPLFRRFDEDAKQSVLQAARLAQGEDLASIGPTPLALACLRTQPALEAPAGLSAARLRSVLRGREADDSSPAVVELPPDEFLVGYLGGLRPAAGSSDLLARFHTGATAELAELLSRHKVTPALIERTAGAYEDPE